MPFTEAMVMGKGQFINALNEGDRVDDVFSIRLKKPVRQTNSGSYFFEVRLGDGTGEIAMKYWGGKREDSVQKVFESAAKGDVVRVKGKVKKFMDNLEVSLNPDEGDGFKKVSKEEYDIADFVPTSTRDIDMMQSQLFNYVEGVKEPNLHALLDWFFTDQEFVRQFRQAPAAVRHHCNWIGGLLEHTLKVTNICSSLLPDFPELDRDLLITGAILHDVGKVHEYEMGTAIEATDHGRLVGHISIGADMVARACDAIPDFPPILRSKVVHMVLSSHGLLEYGSPVVPMFPEALAVSQADTLDASLEEFIRLKNEAVTEDEWTYNKNRGNIYLR
jgi:3'-5' exoribonuclease